MTGPGQPLLNPDRTRLDIGYRLSVRPGVRGGVVPAVRSVVVSVVVRAAVPAGSFSTSTLVSRTVPRTVSGRSTTSLRTTISSCARHALLGERLLVPLDDLDLALLRHPKIAGRREIGRCSISTRSSRTVTVFSTGCSMT